jgi:hypothetical protein
MAIALVESGRNGVPYPWALNIGGKTELPPDYSSALRLLRDADGKVRQDAAVGCLQIALHYHLDRLKSPEWALHPRYNVWYGALFLQELKDRYGDWPSAIAHYHASNPAAQRIYLCQVAHFLARTGPGTARTIGLQNCAADSMPLLPRQPVAPLTASRLAAPLRVEH